VHFVWATWDRLPLLKGATRDAVDNAIQAKCAALKCPVEALGGVEDHVHLAVQLAATVSVAALAKEVKGASSHLVTHEIAPDAFFRWQGSYGAFSFAPGDLPRIVRYIENQGKRHNGGKLIDFLERTQDEEPE
jgi:REP element-mobilizing transposase RayT